MHEHQATKRKHFDDIHGIFSLCCSKFLISVSFQKVVNDCYFSTYDHVMALLLHVNHVQTSFALHDKVSQTNISHQCCNTIWCLFIFYTLFLFHVYSCQISILFYFIYFGRQCITCSPVWNLWLFCLYLPSVDIIHSAYYHTRLHFP